MLTPDTPPNDHLPGEGVGSRLFTIEDLRVAHGGDRRLAALLPGEGEGREEGEGEEGHGER